MLTREMIFAAESSLPHETVSVPEWGGDVFVWGLSGFERDAFEASRTKIDPADPAKTKTKTDLTNFRASLCAVCIRDEAGKRIFSDADTTALGQKSARALERVVNVALRLNGMTREDVEELEKN